MEHGERSNSFWPGSFGKYFSEKETVKLELEKLSRSAAGNENGAGGTLLAEEVTGKQAGKHRRGGLGKGE